MIHGAPVAYQVYLFYPFNIAKTAFGMTLLGSQVVEL